MAYYTVLTPCVVGGLHYARVPSQPIEVDDTAAAELVASGALAPYRPGAASQAPAEDGRDPVSAAESTDEPEAPARPRRRRSHED